MTNEIKYSKIIKNTASILLFVIVVVIACALTYTTGVKNIQKDSLVSIETSIKNIEIKGEENNKYSIYMKKPEQELLNSYLQKNYIDFLIQYNESQAQWLNVWLTILAIALAFLGLIAPLCFMKLYEDKKDEMDIVIASAREQKNEAKLSVEAMYKQIEEIEEKSQKMTGELREVIGYVKETRATAKYAEGINKAAKEENYEKAEILFKEAIELNPSYDSAYSALSRIYIGKENLNGAEEAIRKAIEINPNEDYYDELALCLMKQNKYEAAIENIDVAIAKKPENSEFHARKANICSKMKDVDGTIVNIDRAMEQKTNFWTLTICAVSALEVDRPQKAVECLERTSPLNRNSAFYYNMTEAYIRNNQMDKAVEAIKKYITSEDKKMAGIFEDDYGVWMNKLGLLIEDETVKELIGIINSLDKRPRGGPNGQG